ncbi:MAG: hypothetical protein JOZ57_03430 [Abitibacteriaceae bacterium]|nr:hypothetical protein [Abditibacteriaceae bacterium]
MKQKNIYDDPLSVLFWWYDLAIFVLMFPSNSVIVFLRRNLGYRVIRPWMFQLTFLVLLGLSSMGVTSAVLSGGATSIVTPLLIFALLMGGLAFYHRRRGWELLFDEPNPIHSMSRGDSHLAKVLPMLREDIIQRYIEPAVCILLGLVLLPFAWTLGVWLLLSGVALTFIEGLFVERAVNDVLDRHDARIEAKINREVDEAKATRNAPTLPARKVGGVTLSPELQRLQAARRAAEQQQAATQSIAPQVVATQNGMLQAAATQAADPPSAATPVQP